MIAARPKKRHMTFSSRSSMERMETVLKNKGFTIHCADWDGDWFLVYSDPDDNSARDGIGRI